MQKINWGILGPGNIARKFADGLQTTSRANLQAVASSNVERAKDFAKKYKVPTVHTSYQALAEDPDLDIIYIATTHNFHEQHALLCIEAGKSILIEKPMATNLEQTQRIVDAARKNKVFLMEAMWTRFLPAWVEIRNWLAEGLIGEIKHLKADFGFYGEWNPKNRMFNPDLAGGALLDIGIYPVYLAYMLFGEEPSYVGTTASLCETGVDEQSAYLFGYKNGAIAELSSSFVGVTSNEAIIIGTKGKISVPLFWKAREAFVEIHGEERTRNIQFPYESSGLQYQAEWVMDALEAGKQEVQLMSWAETLQISRRMTLLRESWGMKYPWEK